MFNTITIPYQDFNTIVKVAITDNSRYIVHIQNKDIFYLSGMGNAISFEESLRLAKENYQYIVKDYIIRCMHGIKSASEEIKDDKDLESIERKNKIISSDVEYLEKLINSILK